jgi:biofilm PGA synthesis N-glycosyltransferase PgaC
VTDLPGYALITPARNEARFIEATIQSVVSQTALPLKWVVVSDGSTDGTDEIVRRYAAQYPWIELLRTAERAERHFGGKVFAFNAGLARLEGIPYRAIANLDADITFEADYFAFLLQTLAEEPALGVAGTPYVEAGNPGYDYRFASVEQVSGACQLFRRECFEAIGGYVPAKGGGEDTIAVVAARMKGWKTRTFTEKACRHHRSIGTAQSGALRARFNYGVRDYALGNHPLWEIFRIAYQLTRKPFLLRGLALAAGYLNACWQRPPRPVSPEFVAFNRGEQMRRLTRVFARRAATAALSNHPAAARTVE